MKKLLTATVLTSALLLGACGGGDDEATKEMEKEELQIESDAAPETQYAVEGDYDTALENYEQQLNKDGWETIYENKPSEIKVKKGDETKRIHAVTVNGEVKIQEYIEE